MVGKIVSHYKIVSELGRGGMGIVYKAEDTNLDRTVAIKVLSRHLGTDSVAKKRFIHEAKTASSLDHPNVGTIHEIGETDDGQLFIAMAFYTGENVDDIVGRGPLPIADVLSYAIQTAEGLSCAHAKGIIHRDIKPANLIVTHEGVIKILDFGVSKMASQTQLTKTGTSVGTTLYMSPEQARGDATDHRVDIWALGVALYEMLAGVRPFKSEYEAAVVYSILNEDPEFVTRLRPETPASLERIIEKALAKKVDQRFQTMEEMLGALRDVQKELTAGQTKTRSRGLGRKQRLVLHRALAAVIVAGIALGLYGWLSNPDPVSIAVLPLRYAAADTSQNYFVDGVHEGLIGDFLKIGGWRVRGRSSVMQFRDGNTPVQEIARILDVDYVFEGLISREGENVHFSARLIDAFKDEYVWGDEFGGEFGGIQILQADIAQAVAEQVGIELTQDERQRFAVAKPVNPEAQEAYYRGRYHWGRLTRDDLYESIRWFDQAKEIDPEYAPAYAGIAETYGALLQMGFLSPAEASSKMMSAAARALELDSTLAEVHHMLAVTAGLEWNWAEAEVHHRAAIAANPNLADTRGYYSLILILTGRNEIGIEQAEKAFSLEPTSVLIQSLTGWSLLLVRDFDRAEDRFQHIIEVQPSNLLALDGLWDIYTMKQMYPDALENARALYTAMGEPTVISAFDEGFERDGYRGAMLRAAQMLEGRADSVYTPAYDVARLYLNAGRNRKALQWLKRGVVERSPDTPYIIHPLWDPIRNEPQFQELLRGVHLRE